jgi:hypothetical protein
VVVDIEKKKKTNAIAEAEVSLIPESIRYNNSEALSDDMEFRTMTRLMHVLKTPISSAVSVRVCRQLNTPRPS